jgi:hypothetical protein
MSRPEQARHLAPVPGWGGLPWWRKAQICCSQPTFAYSLLFALIGTGFLVAAPLLDPDLAIVGLVLLAVAVLMQLTFWWLAYRAFGGRRRRRDSDRRPGEPAAPAGHRQRDCASCGM